MTFEDEFVYVYTRIKDNHFHNDLKAYQWMITNNPLLGGQSPVDLIKLGRHEKLKSFVDNAIDENKLEIK